MNQAAFDRLGEFQLYSGLRDFGTKTENPNMVLPEGRYAIVQPGDLFLVLRMNVLWPFYVDRNASGFGLCDRCFVRADTECQPHGSGWRDSQIELFLLNNIITPAPDQDYHDTLAYKSARLVFLKALRDKQAEHLAKELEISGAATTIALERARILEFM